jgi:hypothetical protein
MIAIGPGSDGGCDGAAARGCSRGSSGIVVVERGPVKDHDQKYRAEGRRLSSGDALVRAEIIGSR